MYEKVHIVKSHNSTLFDEMNLMTGSDPHPRCKSNRGQQSFKSLPITWHGTVPINTYIGRIKYQGETQTAVWTWIIPKVGMTPPHTHSLRWSWMDSGGDDSSLGCNLEISGWYFPRLQLAMEGERATPSFVLGVGGREGHSSQLSGN